MSMIDDEMSAMQACVEALRPLPEASRTRVIAYLADGFGRPSPPPSKLQAALSSRAFRSLENHQDRYLWIMRFVCQQLPRPQDLLEVARDAVTGRTRVYFADNRRTIEEAGDGAKAERLDAAHPLWADVNNSTETKRRITRDVMTCLGYGQDDIDGAVAAI